jgi:hypothetical protein
MKKIFISWIDGYKVRVGKEFYDLLGKNESKLNTSPYSLHCGQGYDTKWWILVL